MLKRRQLLQVTAGFLMGSTAIVYRQRMTIAQAIAWDEAAAENALRLLYYQILEHDIDTIGLKTYTPYLTKQNKTLQNIVQYLTLSSDYRKQFVSGYREEDAVVLLYRHLLNREPESWAMVSQHANTMRTQGYRQVVKDFVYSDEYTRRWGVNGVPGIGQVATRDTPRRTAP